MQERREHRMQKKKPLREMIYDRLLDEIVRGKINTGEKLLEAELEKRFRVSRTPVREAIFQLVKEGYVVHKKYVGAVVKKISLQEIREIYEIISLLEVNAVEVVAQFPLGSQELSLLLSLMEEMEKCIEKKEYTEYMRINIQFHGFFNERCGNETLAQIVRDLRKKVYRVVSMGITLSKYADRYLLSHRLLYDAVQAGDPAAAVIAMKAHMEEQKNYLLDALSVLGR
jgi:GntR family transcriptional regulator, rspAB operon transcriptional repressor